MKLLAPVVVLFLLVLVVPVSAKIVIGADQSEKYLPYLKGKRVAILANQTSIVWDRHLVDFLLSKGVEVVRVFGPEHGFGGNASAGTHVADEKDPATGVPVVS